MDSGERIVILAEGVRTVSRGQDALMHNTSNGSWCRISKFAADFFSKPGGISLAREAALMGNGEAVGMLRLAAELADTGIIVEKGFVAKRHSKRVSKAYLIVTRRCNLKCPSCYMGEEAQDDYDEAALIRAAGKVRLMRPSKVYITGGEPCLRDDLEMVIATLKGMKMILCTNGTMPDKVPYEALKAAKASLQISMESCFSDEHDAIRGDGCHKLASITAGKASGMGIEVELVPTIRPGTKIEIDSMLKFAGSLGSGCHGSLMVNVGRGKGEGIHEGSSLLEAMLKYLAKCVISGEIRDSSVLEDIMPMLSKTSCGAGSRIMSCTGDASLHPCHLLWDKPLNDPILASNVETNQSCSHCDVRYLCGGGCLAAADANGGIDPNCSLYKSIYSAFAWGWDDCLCVTENLRRIAKDDYQGHSDHVICTEGAYQI